MAGEKCNPCYGTGWLYFNGEKVICSYCSGTGISNYSKNSQLSEKKQSLLTDKRKH